MKGLSRKHSVNIDIVFWNIYKTLENFDMFLPISCCRQKNEKKNLHSRDISVENKIHFSDACLISKTFPNMFSKCTILSDSHPTIIHFMPLYSDKEIWFDALLFQKFLFINP